MSFNIEYCCISHVGNKRSMNQDNFICVGKYRDIYSEKVEAFCSGTVSSAGSPLIGIFDGMGGEEKGEMASLIASKTAAAASFGKDPVNELYVMCRVANRKICEYAEKNGVASTGTTAALLLFSKDDVFVCNIGDSKIFRCSGASFEQISKDHVAPGYGDKKAPLSQSLGIPEEEMMIEPYISKGPFKNGDTFVISSDGLTDMVAVEEIRKTVAENQPEQAAKILLVRALENGGRDNTTVIICKLTAL